MDKLFKADNPFWNAMGRVFDVFVLNTLWLIFCIPVFTAGPATTALFYSLFGIIRGDGGYPSRDFWKSFRQNFRQGIRLGIPMTLIGAFLAFDIFLCRKSSGSIFSFFLFFFIIIFIVWLAIALYAFPILAKFERKNTEILIWAFTLCIRHFVRTIGMLLTLAVGLWLCHILHGLIFIAFGLIAETVTALLAPVLAPYLPAPYIEDDEIPAEEKDTPNGTDGDIDPWLL